MTFARSCLAFTAPMSRKTSGCARRFETIARRKNATLAQLSIAWPIAQGSCAGAFIVPDLAGDAVHGEADPVHIEGDRSRGKVGFAPRLEAMALARANGVQLLE